MKEGRHRVILQELDQQGVVSVKKLKELLDVTDMTIRRDFIGDYLADKSVSIVTNSLPIFEKLKDNPNYDIILIGGRYRVKTQTFVGQFANKLLKEIKVVKAFIGVNGIDGHNVTTANEEEGNGNAIILNNAIEKYIVADNSKFDSYSFYCFYQLDDLDAVITDDHLSPKIKEKYQSYTRVL